MCGEKKNQKPFLCEHMNQKYQSVKMQTDIMYWLKHFFLEIVER